MCQVPLLLEGPQVMLLQFKSQVQHCYIENRIESSKKMYNPLADEDNVQPHRIGRQPLLSMVSLVIEVQSLEKIINECQWRHQLRPFHSLDLISDIFNSMVFHDLSTM
ncbi:hypothetical protein SAY87_027626 [Trapa incisa]|uniref:Uncharacterized protein n=1 Tax=Trapa incisa TaxID=236973 RepID=A0AAN7JMR4_9MYRT|nr:hypothetical protein SAY87_027626 [Trapa incisa]